MPDSLLITEGKIIKENAPFPQNSIFIQVQNIRGIRIKMLQQVQVKKKREIIVEVLLKKFTSEAHVGNETWKLMDEQMRWMGAGSRGRRLA